MKRRTVLAGLGASLAWPHVASAQVSTKTYKIGLVFGATPLAEMTVPNTANPVIRAFIQGMRELGFIEGRNLIIEYRSAEGELNRYREIITELVSREVDVIVTTGDRAALDAKRVTTSVPIVMMVSYDPVGMGIIDSLANPGGNITGLTNNPGPVIEGKLLQLLKEMLPDANRIIFIGLDADWKASQGESARKAAQGLGISLEFGQVTPTNYADAFAKMAADPPDGFYLAANPVHWVNRQKIADYVVRQRLPSIYPYREITEAGGLISYGSSPTYLFHRSASFVAKILLGTKPKDMPVEQPTKFEMVINLKTAKIIGISVPTPLLSRADEVIE